MQDLDAARSGRGSPGHQRLDVQRAVVVLHKGDADATHLLCGITRLASNVIQPSAEQRGPGQHFCSRSPHAVLARDEDVRADTHRLLPVRQSQQSNHDMSHWHSVPPRVRATAHAGKSVNDVRDARRSVKNEVGRYSNMQNRIPKFRDQKHFSANLQPIPLQLSSFLVGSMAG